MVNSWVLSPCLKVSSDLDAFRCAGRLFQILGPADAKEPFIAVDAWQNTGTTSLDIDDQSIHLFWFDVLMRSIRYPGAVPALHLNTNTATLYAVLSLIFSQGRICRWSEMWLYFLSSLTTLQAMFWIC